MLAAAARDLLDPALVVAERTGHGRAEGDEAGARQRGDVDDRVGLLLGRQGQPVGEQQPALGVGVVDLDRRAAADGQDVAELHRRA